MPILFIASPLLWQSVCAQGTEPSRDRAGEPDMICGYGNPSRIMDDIPDFNYPNGSPGFYRGGGLPALGNIAPYRMDLLWRISQHCKLEHRGSCTVQLSIRHNGTLQSASIIESSASKKIDRIALSSVRATSFAPLPAWCKLESLTFRVDFAKVSKLTENNISANRRTGDARVPAQ